MRLLDMGCGPGAITLDLAAVVASGEVVGIDIEPLQVERAQALATERRVPNARIEAGDAYALPFPDGAFDAVFAHTALFHLRDPLAALREFRRVLRPVGVMGIRDFAAFPTPEPTTPLIEESAALFRRIHDHHRGRPANLLDFQQRRPLLAAGFARAEGYAEVENYGTPEVVREMGRLWADLVNDRHRHVALAEGWMDAVAVDAMIAELRAWAERPDSFSCGPRCAAVGWVTAKLPPVSESPAYGASPNWPRRPAPARRAASHHNLVPESASQHWRERTR
jgi:SAM-dependent methyltransferase